MSKREAVVKLAGADAKTRTVRYVLSTSAADRVNDTIDPAGWQLDNYKKNPVLLYGHDRYTPPIGRALEIGVVGTQLEGTFEFASPDVHPFADTIYKLVTNGFLPGGSVGFMPITYMWNEQTGGIDFKTQELLEFSVVTVPCNPEALAVNLSLMDEITLRERLFPNAFKDLRAAVDATKKAATAASNLGRFQRRAKHNELQLQLSQLE